MLEDFCLTRLSFTVNPQEKILLPRYKGSTLRGGFGHAFKKVNCVAKGDSCEDCILTDNCLYNYVFNTPLPEDSEMMKKYPYAPHPFLIEPPEEEKREYERGDRIEFGLVLIGKVLKQLPYFVYAFQKLGELGLGKGRGEYEVERVEFSPLKGDGESHIVYGCGGGDGEAESNDGKEGLREWKEWIRFPELNSNNFNVSEKFTINLRTPLRVKYQGSLVNDLQFHILFRNLLRRTSLLSFFHCEQEMEVDFEGLIEAAKRVEKVEDETEWYDWKRFSGRQQKWIKMGGIVGKATFNTEQLDEEMEENFTSLLRLGEYIHVGKSTAFGMGRYELGRKKETDALAVD